MKKWLLVFLLTGVAAWLGAQALTAVKPSAELMPAGALLYVEARDFGKLVSDWDASPEKKAWVASANYQSFMRSHLLTRLVEARKGFTDAAGLAEDAPMLAGVAGGESAVGFYHIGKLEFLYITRLPAARFADSALGKVKQKFEPRKAGGRDYFVQTKGENTIAFAVVDDRLILATREDLIASSLRLLAGEKVLTLRDERWFADALGKAPGSGAHDVRFVADLERTAKTPQFRSYWIHQNVSEVRQFASEVADLKFGASEVREDRVLLRRKAQEEVTEGAISGLMRYALPDAGFSQAFAKPANVAELLAQKLFGHGQALERQYQTKAAPDAPEGPSLLGEDDYETRVDTAKLSEASVDAYAPLEALAANTDAVLQTGSGRSSGVLPTADTVVVLHGVTPWKATDVKRILAGIAAAVWSASDWVDGDGYSELASAATPLRFAVNGNLLVVSASPEWMTRVMAGRASSSSGASYWASLKFAQESGGYARMMRLIDFPAIPQGAGEREPLFFSENAASLVAAFTRLDSIAVTAHDTGAMVTEAIVYRKK